jgi:hypothetical protein
VYISGEITAQRITKYRSALFIKNTVVLRPAHPVGGRERCGEDDPVLRPGGADGVEGPGDGAGGTVRRIESQCPSLEEMPVEIGK